MKRKLSIRFNFFLICLLNAVVMILQGISEMVGSNHLLDVLSAIISFSIAAVLLFRARVEPSDELVRKNMGKAAYGTLLFVICACLCIWLYLVITQKSVILLPSFLFFSIAVIFLSFGIQFFAFDKWGKA